MTATDTTATTVPPSSPPTRFRLDPTPRRIRVQYRGHTIGDSTDAVLAFVEGHHPEYLLPRDDVVWTDLEVGGETSGHVFGTRKRIVHTDGGSLGELYVDGPAAGRVQLRFDVMSAWFEEAEQIFAHPRDPYRRVDVIESDRHVQVSVAGTLVAETDRPRLVVETGLPPRWYVPRADVDWSTLVESDTSSACQYKGHAAWWHVEAGDERIGDVVWGYERPVPEASKLAGLVAFYAEHSAVEMLVDGRPVVLPAFEPAWLNPSLHID